VTNEGRGIRTFWQAWKRLERWGRCDGWGGAECRRVYREWLAAGKPFPAAAFIAVAANLGPVNRPFLRPFEPSQN
jgi:hypothetical protein